MSQDLSTQLAEYGQFHEEMQDPCSLEEIADLVDPVRPVRVDENGDGATRARRGWLVAAAAAVLTVVLLGGAIWIVAGNGSEVEPADRPTSTTLTERETAPPTTVATTETPAVAGPTWSSLANADVTTTMSEVIDLAETPFGLLAIANGGMWLSDDGVDWERQLGTGTGIGGRSDDLRQAGVESALAGTIVAFPALPDDDDIFEEGLIESWITDDGTDWVQTVVPNFDWGYRELASNDVGFIAIQPAPEFSSREWAPSDLWFSADGLEWTETGLRSRGQFFLAAGPLGFVVAEKQGATGITLWFSPNGVDWSPYELPRELGGVPIIAASSLGFVVIYGEGVVAYSADGVDWTDEVAVLSASGSGWDPAAASDEGFAVILGRSTWLSPDGTTWTESRLGTPPLFGVRGMIPYGSGFLIYGTADDGGPLWFLEP